MFLKPEKDIFTRLVERASVLGEGATRRTIAISGGADSALVTSIMCEAFGPENVVALFRDVKSDPQHRKDVLELQRVLGFELIDFNANEIYDLAIGRFEKIFREKNWAWCDENTKDAGECGFTNAYASAKSRLTTYLMGFLAKAVDQGGGRIFGTGNAEEDGLVRYFDKYGDGAVDNNIIDGLTKAEVRMLLLYLADLHGAEIFRRIANKTPSADLQGIGDAHCDENELTQWAKNLGFDIEICYGTCREEGNLAWALKQDMEKGVVTGERKGWHKEKLIEDFGYTEAEADLILFLRVIEERTRHKILPTPGLNRCELRAEGFVD